LNCPAEYTNSHLRRQIVLFMATNADYFMEQHHTDIQGLLGPVEDGGTVTSFKGYLQSLLRCATWGDELVLHAISLMWGVRISILLSDSLVHRRIRHIGAIDDSDICLIFTGGNHYVPAGKFPSTLYQLIKFLNTFVYSYYGESSERSRSRPDGVRESPRRRRVASTEFVLRICS
jgi:hypothetical protein